MIVSKTFLLLSPDIFTCLFLFGYSCYTTDFILEKLKVTCFFPWPKERSIYDLSFYILIQWLYIEIVILKN